MSGTGGVTLHAAERTDISRRQGPFTIDLNFPGRMVPGHDDHGYGPLAVVAESLLEPGTYIPMHEHRNEEIVSWVPDGVMRHDDWTVGVLVTDPDHLMVMNAGRSFWHEERTPEDDPALRMLQIFVRPYPLGLEPKVQHGAIDAPVPNEWRRPVGPEGSDAPFFVRNEVDLFESGSTAVRASIYRRSTAGTLTSTCSRAASRSTAPGSARAKPDSWSTRPVRRSPRRRSHSSSPS